ncbi:hypothetical protein KQX54_010866 [Cotesia glomerata]|uniref:Uncharacterized protein n=1 Tax=Cotesia glomerata TaxID=32391 RepID=A0AAV7I2F4_COTGL|nr:hypothetical protein KQX54_010866 [Cotesia glomerata]
MTTRLTANQHKQSHKKQEMLPIAKIRPQRIAARRAREILCLINDDDALWMEENDVDTKDVLDVQIQNENEVPDLPVIADIKEWIESP